MKEIFDAEFIERRLQEHKAWQARRATQMAWEVYKQTEAEIATTRQYENDGVKEKQA